MFGIWRTSLWCISFLLLIFGFCWYKRLNFFCVPQSFLCSSSLFDRGWLLFFLCNTKASIFLRLLPLFWVMMTFRRDKGLIFLCSWDFSNVKFSPRATKKTTNSVRHVEDKFVMYFISPFDLWVLSVQKIEFFCIPQSYLTVVEYSTSFARQKP